MRKKTIACLLGILALAGLPGLAAAGPRQVEVTTNDGLTVYGTLHTDGLTETAPLIHLFHQGGSNGRAEYGPIIPWLNESGYRAIAWDQRSGGETYGGENRTKAELSGQPDGYCDAYADLEAALLDTAEIAGEAPVLVWGSSYSGALVFQLAAKHPGKVEGVIAFSPASGGPLAECKAALFLDGLQDPAFALRPASEMERESSVVQRDLFGEHGISFRVIENGIHGSSALVDERTGHDMSADRKAVLDWLAEIAPAGESSNP